MPEPTYNYLDYDGLALYDEKVKQLIDGKVAKEAGKGLSTNDYTNDEKSKLAGITAGAEPNQNAFGTVVVAGTSLAADSESDTLTITAGDNVTLTPTASSDSLVIAATDTTYPEATATKGGVLSDAQAVKLNGIAAGATKNTASSASPKMDGTTAVGTSTDYARADHVHPSDTSKVDASVTNEYGLSGNITNTGNIKLHSENNGAYGEISTGKTVRTHANNGNDADAEVAVSSSSIILSVYRGSDYSQVSVLYDGVSIDKVVTPTTDTMPTPKSYVDGAIAAAIGDIQGITYEVVTTLPATGKAGVIYLISNSGTAPNIYDEYIWTGSAFEKIGTTDVDLSGYQPLMTAITNTQINALFA